MLQTLEQKIELYKQWKEAYYLGEPIVSDEEFDLLEEELIEMGYDPIVGLAIETLSGKKVTHMNKMLSLGKEKVLSDQMSIEQATYLFNRYSRLGKCVLSWKYDGLAMCAKYINGKFDTLATRGNGDIGQNRTEKFKHLVPMLLDKEWSGEIRFEMVINQRLFETNYSDSYTHSRSLVAGICNDINLDDSRKPHVELICLEAVSEDGSLVHPQQLSNQFMKTFKEAYVCCSPEQLQHEFNRAVTR
jgi:DNA ligase (NAD+)